MSKSAHPKFIGLTLTPSGGMLGAWEDGSVARWYPKSASGPGFWSPIPSPDYEALFCTTTRTYADLTLAPEVQEAN